MNSASSLSGEVQLGKEEPQLAPRQAWIHAVRSCGGRASHVRARLQEASQVAKQGRGMQPHSSSTHSDRPACLDPRPARHHPGCSAMTFQVHLLELVSNFACVTGSSTHPSNANVWFQPSLLRNHLQSLELLSYGQSTVYMLNSRI